MGSVIASAPMRWTGFGGYAVKMLGTLALRPLGLLGYFGLLMTFAVILGVSEDGDTFVGGVALGLILGIALGVLVGFVFGSWAMKNHLLTPKGAFDHAPPGGGDLRIAAGEQQRPDKALDLRGGLRRDSE